MTQLQPKMASTLSTRKRASPSDFGFCTRKGWWCINDPTQIIPAVRIVHPRVIAECSEVDPQTPEQSKEEVEFEADDVEKERKHLQPDDGSRIVKSSAPP